MKRFFQTALPWLFVLLAVAAAVLAWMQYGTLVQQMLSSAIKVAVIP